MENKLPYYYYKKIIFNMKKEYNDLDKSKNFLKNYPKILDEEIIKVITNLKNNIDERISTLLKDIQKYEILKKKYDIIVILQMKSWENIFNKLKNKNIKIGIITIQDYFESKFNKEIFLYESEKWYSTVKINHKLETFIKIQVKSFHFKKYNFIKINNNYIIYYRTFGELFDFRNFKKYKDDDDDLESTSVEKLPNISSYIYVAKEYALCKINILSYNDNILKFNIIPLNSSIIIRINIKTNE